MLPAQWTTERLLLRNVMAADSPRLLAIFNGNAPIGAWDPTFHPIPQAEMDGLVAASLARRNTRGDAFQMQALCWGLGHARAGEIIGYYHLVYGAPQPELVWIGMMVIDPQVQNGGLGSEALAGVGRRLRELATYRAARVEVWLKNWPALRLWAKAGFDRIVKFRGDPLLAPESQASVVLEQDLRG